jgi:hypothetical protein
MYTKMSVEHWWNTTDRRKPKYSEKNVPSATLSTTYLTLTELGSNSGLHGEI